MANSKNIKVLIVSKVPLDERNAAGNTYANFFSGIDGLDIINIYLSEGLPDNNFCSEYFNISLSQLIWGIKNKDKIGKRYTKEDVEILRKDSKLQTDINRENELISKHRNKKGKLLHVLRELIWWVLGSWKNEALNKFIDDNEIDIVFATAAPPLYFQRVLRYALKRSQAKLVTFFADDVYSYKSKLPLPLIYQYRIRKRLKDAVHLSTKIYSASSLLAKEYSDIFDKKIQVLYKGCDIGEYEPKLKVNKPIHMVYAGNLFYNRWKTLAEVTKELVRINDHECKIFLDIFTATGLNEEMDKSLNIPGTSKVNLPITYDKVKKEMASADIVLHVESFDSDEAKRTRLSFSTKIIDCMQSGSCMMAIGPKELASIDYVNGIKGVLVAESISKIRLLLNKCVENPDVIKFGAEELYKFAKRNHDLKKVRTDIKNDIVELITINMS